MADNFTRQHFELLQKWAGTTYDARNAEHEAAHRQLKEAFEVTKRWAAAVSERCFPDGRTKTVCRPLDQWQRRFRPYNWGRIYPGPDAPPELAYTVGIDAERGFVVKIDVVDTATSDRTLRPRYEAIRGEAPNSPFVATLSADEGLQLPFTELVAWSIRALQEFGLTYDDLVSQLGLRAGLSDEELLRRFDSKPAFQAFRASWSAEDSALFCRLARAVHAAGLDWWHSGRGIQLRFGRKNPGAERAIGVLGVIRGTQTRKISLTRPVGDVAKLHREALTESVVAGIEAGLATDRDSLDEWLVLDTDRPGLWPDQLHDDPPAVGADDDIDEAEAPEDVMKPLNLIFYGPPGTGKTYTLTKLLKERYEETLTPDLDEEWRQELIATRIAPLTWWEGAAAALYELGRSAKVRELHDHAFIRAIAAAKGRSKHIQQTLWGTLQHHTIEDSKTVNSTMRLAPAVFDKSADSTWHLAGDWEESCADVIDLVKAYQAGAPKAGVVKRYSFVTFHQSYGYEEFVEGLRPVLREAGESGQVQYEIRPGVFKELCRRARLAKDQRFAMVIDEINRGNISKIFGELITLIEPDKREGAANQVSIVLPYSGDEFSVPANVDIIGTMNTADRSLALLDTALRRRFEFQPLTPDARDEPNAPLHGLRVTVANQVIDVPRLLGAMNQRIEALYDRDHCIGHAYLFPLRAVHDGEDRFAALKEIFANRIVPLLEEYFFEDWQKIRLVLADNQKSADLQFVREGPVQEDDLARLFGGDHGLDSYATKPRFSLNPAAFSDPRAYVAVYETLVA